ncbi:MAG: zinc-ribbon domain-containing protein [Deltaproteobacteria bacterium]|nr:zinc-ribbon domain-containing protein [Deltaproteobacteria bacterium]
MEITCDSCQTKLKIADEKIPLDRTATFACPKCKGKITITADSLAAAAAGETAGTAADLGFEEETFETSEEIKDDRPFQFIEEEGKTAVVCETDPVIRKRAADILKLLEYHVTTAQDNREALKMMRYQNFDVVVVNEAFGTDDPDANGILIYLERLQMDVRRNMFVAMISERFRTMDYMMAFNRSVNLIINKENAADMDKILSKGISDYDMFYRIFKETMV